MELNSVQSQLLDVKIKQFKDFIDEFEKMFAEGRMSYNMWRSQYGELLRINEEQKKKNAEAEEQVVSTLKANESLKVQGQAIYDKRVADATALWSKAHSKFKEVEKLLDEAERKRIKEAVKDLEKVAVAA